MESGDANEAVDEVKTGVKQALSMSPQASGKSRDAVEVSSTGGRGPKIKRVVTLRRQKSHNHTLAYKHSQCNFCCECAMEENGRKRANSILCM
jgi:hypothetical protein